MRVEINTSAELDQATSEIFFTISQFWNIGLKWRCRFRLSRARSAAE
jgi:hypothetical protein